MGYTKAKYVNPWMYRIVSDGLTVRELSFDTERGGDPVTLVHLTDLHFNFFHQRDFEEANPVLMSTYENRKWLAGGASVPTAVKCLEYGKTADKIMITGDILDSLSYGSVELAKKHIFEPYGQKIMASLGNHETSRQVQGTVKDPTSLQSRIEILANNWCNDIYYSSDILGDKVMVIQMDNASQFDFNRISFWDHQIKPLSRDLALARERGYAVLIFSHCNISTGDPQDSHVRASMIGDKRKEYGNFYDSCAKADSEGATGIIYNMIVNNGDIIKGYFCGHQHSDFYTEILAKTPSGADTVIPQYCMMASIYGNGHILKITVK